MKYSLLQWYKI